MAEAGAIPFHAAAAQLARTAAQTVVDLVLPSTCLACKKPVGAAGGLCPACWTNIGFIERPYCERLGVPFPNDGGGVLLSPAALADPPAYDRARAAARFGDVARDLVHLLKYGDRLDLARPLGRWMARAGAELLADADALVPVPLHWTRLWRRRFNQSAMLARAISAQGGVPVADHILARKRATPPQVGLGRPERARNVQGAFVVPKEARIDVKGRKLIVIDDVLTSGATADACARVLRRAGASRVDVLVFARVVGYE
ncbi:MAG: ComF family protein [Bradyrhizobiaceae bacterium]|nr:ComF family protein [Bradyrhizobiaceae bacterium]